MSDPHSPEPAEDDRPTAEVPDRSTPPVDPPTHPTAGPTTAGPTPEAGPGPEAAAGHPFGEHTGAPGGYAAFNQYPPYGQYAPPPWLPPARPRGPFARLVRHRATHLVAAGVLGAVIGGGIVGVGMASGPQLVTKQPGYSQNYQGQQFPGNGRGLGGRGYGRGNRYPGGVPMGPGGMQQGPNGFQPGPNGMQPGPNGGMQPCPPGMQPCANAPATPPSTGGGTGT